MPNIDITAANLRWAIKRILLHTIATLILVTQLQAKSICAEIEGSTDAHARAPNIILILADDMGYSDIGCYGSEIQTPTLDGLAADGVRFTQFYNTARCCPTRASLLTGLYPHQAGVGWMMTDRGHPGYRGELNDKCVTIAQVLKTAGYDCYMAGKWHVTPKGWGERRAASSPSDRRNLLLRRWTKGRCNAT